MTDRTLRTADDLDGLAFDESGLVSVTAQDAETGRVLMQAWATREALERTLETGEMHYWSRSRGDLWRKGATSGNTQALASLHADCDGDSVLALVRPAGPACHTGETTCFGEGAEPGSTADGAASAAPESTAASSSGAGRADTLDLLWAVLQERAAERPEGSYTVRLLDDANLRLKKLGEETTELVLELARRDAHDRIASEAADLVYHLLVALLAAGVTLDDLRSELEARRR